MSRIFLSHSSNYNFEAVALRDWLNENGWDDVVLQYDPDQDAHPSDRPRRALQENVARCEAVIFLVSRDWLDSQERRDEYEFARKVEKAVFVVLIEELASDPQLLGLQEPHGLISLVSGEDDRSFRVAPVGGQEERRVSFSVEGLGQLKAKLERLGIDTRSFDWPPRGEPERAPYRGLEPFEAEDAGIFFGREEPLIEALDVLRGLAKAPAPRLFVVLGASGVGKSSFLRAGLWPRLGRDDGRFLPLPIVRPERAAMSGADGFVAALARAAEKAGCETSAAQIREAVAGAADGPRPLLRELAARAATAAASSTPPTLVVMIDRAEELFHAEGARESQSLLELLRDFAMMDDPAVIVVFAIRSDSYDALAEAKALEGLRQRVFPLAPMQSDGCRAAIERPAERVARAGVKLEIDPDLTSALLKDQEKCGNDALPLLALVLEQLYRVFGGTKRIARADYEPLGKLAGAIDAALGRVFEAADKDVRIPKQQEARLALMRRGLVPWLAGVDPATRTARRRIAGAAQIPQDARPLIDLLVGQRLLTHKLNHATGEATFELAHEALMRRWATLKDWLDEDFELLARLEGVKRASREWEFHSRSRAYATHAGALLEEAERLYARPDFTARLDASDRAYLAACIEKAKLVREEEKAQGRAREEQVREKSEKLIKRARNARWEAWISSVGLAAALAMAALGGWQWLSATKAKSEAQAQRERAERTLAQAADAANGLAFDLAEKFGDLSAVPAPIKADILSETRKLQEQLLAGGAKGDNLRRGESVVLNEIAQARLAMGESAGALAAARQSAALMAALSAAEPENAGWRRDLSVSYEKLGDVQQAMGDLDGALKSFSDDLAIAAALSASDPDNAQRRWDLSISYEKLGDVQQARNDLNGALNAYREALVIREKVSGSDPGNVGWQRDLAVSLERVGATLTRQGDATGAIAAFEQALVVYRGLARAHPDDARSLVFSIVPHLRLAELDRAKQREHLEAALAILEPLAAEDRLDAKRRGWLTQIKAQLKALGQAAPAPRSPAVEPALRQQ